MVSNNIDKKIYIKTENLNIYQYTNSLLEEAFKAGMINKSFITAFQSQVIFILKDLIKRYTKNESTSVSVETAESLLNSLYYSIDAYTSSLKDPESCIELLKVKSLQEIYNSGIEIVSEAVIETMMLLNEVKENKLDIQNEVYNDTIEKGIPKFFKSYNLVFNAQNGDCDIDYPLLFDDMKLRGIFYIKEYLEKLKMENEFCSYFNKIDIQRLFIDHASVYKIDSVKFPINIFEIVLTNNIFSVLSGNEPSIIILSKLQGTMIINNLKSMDSIEINMLISEAAKKIIKYFNEENTTLSEYIKNYINILVSRISTAAKNNNLSNIVITSSKDDPQTEGTTFYNVPKMKDEDFRTMIQELMECENIEGKITIINENIKSLEDFIDMLKSNCLFNEEMKTIFSTLSVPELSVLENLVFSEELRNGELAPNNLNADAKEEEWQKQFTEFIKELKKNSTN
ncbi:MAG: DUF6179 domain-containing protein [Bacillota bacterium]|nr:DUF6179 domain-containing protein [Bacillota bacterium]